MPNRSCVLILTLALVSCGTSTDERTITGDPTLLPPGSSGSPVPGRPSTAGRGTRPASARPIPGQTFAEPQPTATAPAGYRDAGGVGEMARTYLRRAPARTLAVEIDFVSGRRPSQAAMDHLRAVLEREADKPDGVRVEAGNEIPASQQEYTLRDIERLERAHRARRSSGSTATIWIAYLNGDLRGEAGTLGVATTASTAVLFADRIDSAATALIRPGAIERAVLTHEIGHLLALINIGYTSAHDHEDPDHRAHSRFRGSVMYWAIEDISVASVLGSGPPDDFDEFDRDDLDLLRGT